MLGRTCLIATAGALALAPAAQAQLPPMPDPFGVISQVTGTVGGLVGDPAAPLQPTLDDLLGTIGPMPTTAADPSGAKAAPAAGGAGAVVVGPGTAGGAVVVDGRAPTVGVTVLSHLRTMRRRPRLVLRVTASEPAVVGLTGTVRPGATLRKYAKRKAASRASLRLPRAVLAFRRAGALRVTISLSRAAETRLARARNGRLSVTATAIDLARNQAARSLRRQLKR